MLINIAASENTCQDSRLDTLNSKIHPLLIILWQNRDQEEYNDKTPPTTHFQT